MAGKIADLLIERKKKIWKSYCTYLGTYICNTNIIFILFNILFIEKLDIETHKQRINCIIICTYAVFENYILDIYR